MKMKALLTILFTMILASGSAMVANAQTNPDNKEKTTNRQKDDEREEKVSPKERKQVKISAEQARKTALERVGGTIIEEELEKENGRIVYSIEIRQENQQVYDVEIDAATGEVVNVEEEIEDGEDDSDDDEKPKETKPPQKAGNETRR